MSRPDQDVPAHEITARIEALRFEFSYPGGTLAEFSEGLRERARGRRVALWAVGLSALVVALSVHAAAPLALEGLIVGATLVVLARGSARCTREERAALELEWLGRRLESFSRGPGAC